MTQPRARRRKRAHRNHGCTSPRLRGLGSKGLSLSANQSPNLGSRAITWTSALSMICNALLPNEVLGSMGGGILGESNLKKLLVKTVTSET